MMQTVRRVINSTIGKIIALVFLVLIALAFAGSDVTGLLSGHSVPDSDVARVGKGEVTTNQLSQAATAAVEREKQQTPGFDIHQLIALGGLNDLLEQLIDAKAISEFGRKHGIVAGKALVDSELTQIPAFRGLDGKFNNAQFQQLIRQRGISEADLRDQIASWLIARQLLVPASFGATVPHEMATRYAAMYRETRTGEVALLPSAAFAPTTPPTQQQMAGYYSTHQRQYIRPERRVLRYALFGEDAVRNLPAPTDAEIAARFNQNKAAFAPSETRDLVQLILPTEAAAQAALAEVKGGKSLDAVAAGKGLVAGQLEKQSRTALSGATSAALADAVFTAQEGAIAGPVHSPLGWHLIKVAKINRDPGKTLEQAKPEIVAALTAEKKHTALSELSAKLEQQIDNGATLAQAAQTIGVTVTTTAPVVADGRIYGSADAKLDPQIASLVGTAFSMEHEGQPQVAEVVPGKTFALFDVAQILPSAPAPLAEITAEVAHDFLRDAGFEKARAAAGQLLRAAPKGVGLAEAAARLHIPAQVQHTSIRRDELTGRQQVPPALTLMFSMAQGTTKSLGDNARQGYLIVALAKIEPGVIAPNDPLLAQVGERLGASSGRELSDQLRLAMRKEVGVTVNAPAVKAVAQRLTGGGN